ncbi:DUF3397 domain-containing protein [Paenibacillus shirakamiensis]|nr:DUF3397 domain-containing protein [Paenibacillus shirakamiensis]
MLFAPIIAFSIAPIVPFILVYFIHYFWKGGRKQSIMLAMDVTTFFLILSVAALFNHIFNSTFGIYLILLILLIIGGFIGGAQNRLKGRLDPKRLIRAVWRLAFLGTVIMYILFIFIGIFPYILSV